MEREALKLALEALEAASRIMDATAQQRQDDAITAIKEALAQPAQAEVLAQAVPDETLTIVYQSGFYDGKKQQQLVDLTVGEWFDWWRVSQVANETEAEIDFADFLIIAQAVAAKLKEKNG